MVDDKHTLQLLGEIKGGQDVIQKRFDQHEIRIDDTIKGIHKIHQETTRGFGDVKALLVGVTTELHNHIADDLREFSQHKKDIDGAHIKISNMRSVEEMRIMSTKEKLGWIGGILSGLGAFGVWLANHLSKNN